MAEMTGFQRLIGGLLGENMEGMTEEQRRRLAREGGTAAILGMLSGSGLLGGLEGLRARRKEQATEAEAARRTAAVEAEMPRIAGRLFGGTAGTLESLPGGEGGPLTSRYRQAPQEALARLTGTQVGRDVAKLAPDLATLATEGVTGRTVGGAVYNPLTGRFEQEPKAQVKTLTPQEVAALSPAMRGAIIQRSPSGELNVVSQPPRAAGAGGGGVGGGGGGMFLTPAEVAAEGLAPGTVVRRRDGAIVQRPATTKGGAIPTEGPMAGMTPRQQSGAFQARTAALQYAANITGMSVAEISKKSPQEIEQLIKQKGGRLLQGGLASSLANTPIIGDFMKGIVEAANADLIAPSVGGGSGIAQMQTVGNTMSDMDLAAGQRQFPNPMYPVEVQAQMIRSILERSGGVVEQYDEKGNKVTR
jgi:hypothetical protein